jgi:PAS domain S-box-containing protein
MGIKAAAARLFGRLSLQHLLVLLFTTQVLVVGAVVAFIAFRSGHLAVLDAAERLRAEVTARVVWNLERTLGLPMRLLQQEIAEARSGEFELGDADRLSRHFWRRGKVWPGIGTMAFASAQGELSGANEPERYVVLASRALTGGAIRRFEPDGDGRRTARVLRDVAGYDARDRDWFRRAAAAPGPLWTGITASATGPRLDLTAATPYRDASGNLVGIFFVDLSLARLNTLMRSVKIGDTGVAWVMERNGDLVASSTSEEPFVRGSLPDRLERLRAVDSKVPVIAAAAASLAAPAAGLAKMSSPRNEERRVGGERWFIQYTPFASGQGIDWLVVVAVSEREYLGRIQRATRAAILLVLAAMVAAVFTAIATARWVAAPVRRLADSAAALAQGHWDVPTVPERHDEVGRLAGAFAAMAARLRDLVSGLEREVEERQRTAERLAEAEEHARLLTESAGDVVLVTDLEGRLESLNPVFTRLTGERTGDWLGRSVLDLVHPDDVARVRETLAPTLAGRELGLQEYRIRGPGDTWVVAEVHAFPRLEKGRSTGVVGFVRDITERRRLEAQLVQAQKMEAVGLLAAGIAHDFNNLLTAVSGHAALLECRLPEGHPGREHVRVILDVVDRATQLTRSLLTFGRKRPPLLEPVRLNEVVEGVGGLLRRLIGEDILLEMRLDPAQPAAVADAGQIGQVLMNLVTNARDAMPRGGRITITTGITAAPGAAPRAFIEVEDNGSGMDAATRARLFEPFFTTKEDGRGTGLGLAMVHSIVRQHGGSVEVESAPGAGARFRILLIPLRHDDRDSDRAGATAAGLPRGSETILLVEDDDAVRNTTRAMLEAYGYTVLEARDGSAGLALWRRQRAAIALVLTDVIMPVLGGVELARTLRREDPAVRLRFMSGYPGSHGNTVAADLPDVVLLAKPLRLEELLRAVRAAIDG